MITGQRHVAGEDVMVRQRYETVVRLRVFIAVELVRLKPGADCEVLNSVQRRVQNLSLSGPGR